MQIIKKLHHDPIRPIFSPAPFYEARSSDRKIALPTMEGIHFERIQTIISLEAKGNYTMLHFTEKRKLLVCKTLRDMENQIHTGSQFVRIHRSFTINLNYLQKYVKGKSGYVVMENGVMISVSIGKKHHFMNALKTYFG